MIMSKIKDSLEDMKLEAHKELCEREPEPKCEYCNDTGIVEISGDDGRGNWDVVDSKRCGCNQD
jgi:hypothetical protein